VRDFQHLATVSIVVMLIFVTIDSYSHNYIMQKFHIENIPQDYFREFLYGSFLMFLALNFIDDIARVNIFIRIFLVSTFVVFALQYRDYGLYSLQSNIYVIAFHKLILFPLLYYGEEFGYIK